MIPSYTVSGICLDIFPSSYGEKATQCKKLMDTLEAYKFLKPYISYIHVKDALQNDGSVVPAGMGDGNVAVILKDLYNNGFDGYLSLEPHLFNFQGLAALENSDKKTLIQEGKTLSGFEAFSLAHESLLTILKKI